MEIILSFILNPFYHVSQYKQYCMLKDNENKTDMRNFFIFCQEMTFQSLCLQMGCLYINHAEEQHNNMCLGGHSLLDDSDLGKSSTSTQKVEI